MRKLLSNKPALFALLMAAMLGTVSLFSRADDAVSANGLGHRSKPSAYSNEKDGLFLGVDASQASWRAGGSEKYLPIAIVLANTSKNGVWINDSNWTLRAGEVGVWQSLPTYKEVMDNVMVSTTTRHLLGEYDPFTTRFRALRRSRYSPFPGNDPERPRLRVEEAWVSGQSYVYAMMYIPNPGKGHETDVHYLRFTDPKAKVDITTGFHIKEPK